MDFLPRQRVTGRRGDAEGLLVQGHRFDAGAVVGQREDHGVEFARLEHAVQVGGGVLLHVQRHFRRGPPQRADQIRQQVGRDRVNDPQAQDALERVAPLARDRLHALGLLQRAARLRHDLLARLGEEHAALAALEQLDAQLLLEVLHGCGQTRLRDEAALRGLAEMARFGDGDDVPEFGQCHRVGLL